jgi:hypothetical protein
MLSGKVFDAAWVLRIGLMVIIPIKSLYARIPERKVIVCLDKGSASYFVTVTQAQGIAGRLFAQIGVQIEWHDSNRLCPSSDSIRIRIIPDAPERFRPGALASSQPFGGGSIMVFWNRVNRALEGKATPQVLGHVLVHEITHSIRGTDTHSDRGIMRARWDGSDYDQMIRSSLRFTEEDVQAIYQAFERKARGRNK